MPLLTDLKDQLEKLPKKKQRKNLAGSMEKYAGLVAAAAASLKNSVDRVGFARAVFPEEDFTKVLTRVRQAAARAAKLKKRLVEDIDAVAKNASEQDVTRLGEHAKDARAALKERWQVPPSRSASSRTRGSSGWCADPELAPKGERKLGALLDELRRQVARVPASQTEADSIRGSLDDLPRVIETLGLEGEVGEFLVQAASGLGDPEKLYRPAIRDFFKGLQTCGAFYASRSGEHHDDRLVRTRVPGLPRDAQGAAPLVGLLRRVIHAAGDRNGPGERGGP